MRPAGWPPDQQKGRLQWHRSNPPGKAPPLERPSRSLRPSSSLHINQPAQSGTGTASMKEQPFASSALLQVHVQCMQACLDCSLAYEKIYCGASQYARFGVIHHHILLRHSDVQTFVTASMLALTLVNRSFDVRPECALQGISQPGLPERMKVRRWLTAYEAGRALVATVLRRRCIEQGKRPHVEAVQRVTILPRGGYGSFRSISPLCRCHTEMPCCPLYQRCDVCNHASAATKRRVE